MANEIVISKITPNTMVSSTIEWIYGTDSNARHVTTSADLSSIPLADRQSNEKVKEFLKNHLHESVFKDLDDDISKNSVRVPE